MYRSNEPTLFKIVPNDNHETGRLSSKYKIKLENNYKDFDTLNTKKHVDEFYKSTLLKGSKRFNRGIIGFVSQFGNGKTFFLQYLYCKIFEAIKATNKNYPIYIDISKFEHQKEELLLLILSEIIRQLDLLSNSDKKGLKNIKDKFMKLFPSALKAVSVGVLGALTGGKQDTLISAIGDISQEFGIQIINSMNQEEQFLKQLEDLLIKEKNSSFLIIMDNLDRCRPEFVLNLLVVLKRLFDVEGMTFLLSYDKQQIINLLHAQYGKNVDIQSYIKKYIAYEYYMPQYTKEIQKFTFHALKNNYTPQDSLTETFQKGKENFYRVWEVLQDLDFGNELLPEDNASKFMLAYIWQHLFLNSTLSLRKYEQGFLHIRQAKYLKEVSNHIVYIMLLYIKFNFPSEYQAILYRIDELSGYSMFDADFLEKINEIYTVLSDSVDKLQKSFADLFGDEVSKSIIRQAYAMIELHSLEDEVKV